MPIKKVKGGYKWGKSGKVYKTKKQAQLQARAIYASGYKKKKMTITTSASIGGAIGERKLRRGFSLQYKGASIMYKKGKKSYGKKGKKSSYGKKKKR